MSKNPFLSTKVKIKNIFLGLLLSLFVIFSTLFIARTIINSFTEEPDIQKEKVVLEEKIIEKVEQEVAGEEISVDQEVVPVYVNDVREYLSEVKIYVYTLDISFKAMNYDVSNNEKYAKVLNGFSEDCIPSKYPYEKEIIPNPEIVEKIEKMEEVSTNLCDDMITVTNLIPEDDNPDVLGEIRDINEDAYNKTLVLEMLVMEVEEML